MPSSLWKDQQSYANHLSSLFKISVLAKNKFSTKLFTLISQEYPYSSLRTNLLSVSRSPKKPTFDAPNNNEKSFLTVAERQHLESPGKKYLCRSLIICFSPTTQLQTNCTFCSKNPVIVHAERPCVIDASSILIDDIRKLDSSFAMRFLFLTTIILNLRIAQRKIFMDKCFVWEKKQCCSSKLFEKSTC